jgi:hypothetical protein
MYILLSPQFNDNQKIHYRFDGEVITITIGSTTDIFDFTGLPIGEVGEIDTVLTINPIVNAERKEDGQMYVELINFIDDTATESEKFPSWTVV